MPQPHEQPYRQVHLDFHTSEHIGEVAAEFDPEAFAETLVQARVNSIQCFARCWHGWMYYDSAKFPEAVHPGLKQRDLLPAQIAACHRRGIRVPIYVAVQMDRRNAYRHPEWVQITPDGRLGDRPPFQPGLGPQLCLHSPFRNFLFEHLAEILARMPVDGFWFDGVTPQDCCCRHCQDTMLAEGLDPAQADQRKAFGNRVVNGFMAEMSALVRERFPEASLFYNSGHIGPRHRALTDSHTHFEIESLPGGGWGYLHFPTAVRLARTLGRQVVGLTGKFHTAWGDFHSFKNPAALEFECFQMLAQGSRCSIGDQLHPSGRICPHTYQLIGSVYRQVEAVEPWCRGARPLAEIGLLTSEGLEQCPWEQLLPAPVLGAVRLLQESALQFDIVDRWGDFHPYRLLILPDEISVDDALAGKIRAYLQNGGRILSSARSGLHPAENRFSLAEWGVEWAGDSSFSRDFIRPGAKLGKDLPATEHVMYGRAVNLIPAPATEVLAERREPCFERTWRHFCAHVHSPTNGRNGGPAVTRCGPVIHFAHPVFGIYRAQAPRWCKVLAADAVRLLLGPPLLSHNGPSTLLATVHEQPAEKRLVVHLLHYVPERRGREMDIIEDRLPLHDLTLSLAVEGAVAGVELVPERTALPFAMQLGRITVTVPKVNGHQMLAVRLRDGVAPSAAERNPAAISGEHP